MALAPRLGVMAQVSRVIGRRTKCMDSAAFSGQTANNMKVIGNGIGWMAMVSWSGPKAATTKANSWLTKDTATASTPGRMDAFMTEAGSTASSMALAS